MAVGLYGQALGTVGVEFEGTGLQREILTSAFVNRVNQKYSGWGNVLTVGRDASVEFVAENLRLNHSHPLVSTHTPLVKKIRGFGDSSYRRTLGYELITAPLEISQLEPVIYDTVYSLISMGDYASNRASTHFHIGFPHNFGMLKKLLRVCLMLDPVLFRLGGMGGEFRGSFNLACYARPLMNSACVLVDSRTGRPTDEDMRRVLREQRERLRRQISETNLPAESEESPSGKWVQIANPLGALEAENIEQFWASFGISITNPTAHKYHPVRYSGTNFYALPSHGTIEFRHPNYSRDPELVVAIAKFLRGAVEMSALMSKSETYRFEPISPNEEISVSDGVDVISRIVQLAREKEVEDLPTDRELEVLVDTLGRSSFRELPETPVKTHVKDFTLSGKIAARGNLRVIEKPLKAKNVDIHNISNMSLSLFE